MKLPVKITLGASVVSMFCILLLFNNIHNQLTLSQKSIAIEKNREDLENLKNTTALILQKAKNVMSIISVVNSKNNKLEIKIKQRFEFYMKNIPEISELKYITMSGEELVRVSNKRLFSEKDMSSHLDNESFKMALKEEVFIGNIHFADENNEMMVEISKRVTDVSSEQPMGVIVAKISMYSIQEMISDKLIYFDAIALFDLNQKEFLYKSSYVHELQESQLLSSENEISNIVHSNDSYLIVSSHYKNQGLNLKYYLFSKESTLFAEINKTIKENLQLLILTILLSSLIMFYLITYMLRPLNELTQNIIGLSNKIDSKLVDKINTNDEVKEIRLYFERFVELIKEEKLKLKEFNANLQTKVEEEVVKNNEKEQMLFQQSKMASMGEMIGNIAHQWRQPIAIISMWSNNIIIDVDMDEVDNKSLLTYANNINTQTKHLSQTIDDFRNFFAPNKERSTFTLKSSIEKTMNLLNAAFKMHDIEVIQELEDIEITALENELTQAILNIINNAKDILLTMPPEERRLIFIKIYKQNKSAVIEVTDNGGGVPEDILDKIFEPYFTTKHQSQGTGIGLYMTESIITKHLYGRIAVKNSNFTYDKVDYLGAKFTITLPMVEEHYL